MFLLNSGSLLIIYSKQQNEQSHGELTAPHANKCHKENDNR